MVAPQRECLETMADQALGIYIQVPFCQAKCTYCNFHTGVFSPSLYASYVEAVCREIREHASLYDAAGISVAFAPGARRVFVDTVYVGGGTPSLLEARELTRLADAVRETFSCAREEATLEADPETVTPDKAAAWHAAGFNRVSLGVQSFHDGELQAAGRRHRPADIFSAVRALRQAGFTNLSCDLIAGLPHQTAASWEASLEELLALRPEHVSVYLLELDEASRLGRAALAGVDRYHAGALPSEDDTVAFYEQARRRLARSGYEHYEISNFALPGFRSRHNLKYWCRQPYLGFGAGAHSFHGRQRWAHTHDPAAYVAAITQGRLPVEQFEELTRQQAFEEELFLGLRRLDGIDVRRLERNYGAVLAPHLEPLRQAGRVEFDGTTLRLAPSALAVANEVFVPLLDARVGPAGPHTDAAALRPEH